MLINFNEKLDNFICKNTKTEMIIKEMALVSMETCVRSCMTKAFDANKGIFKKKPKADKCFSILEYKSINKQETIDIECIEESECIKYVDLITMLLQNMNVKSK